ncbi:hypothetical protein HJC23_007059 [Cyclotella cryptica]|uniref:Uncharacterized protein n=1 Tax=Cyclotella cryptica TaxID=29204 RepID=A0ABD3P925_9STRA
MKIVKKDVEGDNGGGKQPAVEEKTRNIAPSAIQSKMDPREREAKEAMQRQRQQLLDRAYDEVVVKQLEKLGARKTFTGQERSIDANAWTVGMICVMFASGADTMCKAHKQSCPPATLKTIAEDDEEAYRRKMALDREKATSRKRKAISAEHAELARTTGLSGQVVALMAGHDGEDSDGAGSNSSDDDRRRRKRKKRKHRKEKSKKSRKEKRRDDHDDDDRSQDDTAEGKSDHSKNDHHFNDKHDNGVSKGKAEKKFSRRPDSDDNSMESSSSSSSSGSRKRSKKKRKHKSKSKSRRSKR